MRDEWESTFGSTADLCADGNADGLVSGADFLLWQRNLSNAAVGIGASISVPEPTGLTMLMATALIVSHLRFEDRFRPRVDLTS